MAFNLNLGKRTHREALIEGLTTRLTSLPLSDDISPYIKSLAQVILETTGHIGSAIAIFDRDAVPIFYGSAGSIEVNLVHLHKDLSRITRIRESGSNGHEDWPEIQSHSINAPGIVLCQSIKHTDETLVDGLLLLVQSTTKKKRKKVLPGAALRLLGWLLNNALQRSSLKQQADLHQLAAEEINKEQLPMNPKRIAGRLREILRAHSVTILVEQFGRLYLSATTDDQLNTCKYQFDQKNSGLTGLIFMSGKSIRLPNAATSGEAHITISSKEVAASATKALESLATSNEPYRFLGVPMCTKGDDFMKTTDKVSGVIRVLREANDPPFTSTEERILQQFAGLLGATLDASRLLFHYKHIRRAKSEAICIWPLRRTQEGGLQKIAYVNPGAQELFGRGTDEVVDQLSVEELYSSKAEFKKLQEPLEQAMRDRVSEYGPVRTTVRGTENESRCVDISFRFISDPHVMPEMRYGIAIMRDSTEYLNFINSIGHQLRAPIGAMLHTLLNLKGRLSGNEWWKDRLTYAIGQARDCSRLTKNLAYMDELLRGKRFTFNPVNLARIAIGTKLDFEHLLAVKDLTLLVNGPSLDEISRHREIWGHEGLVQQIFQNLIDNAIKYSRSGTRIRVNGFLAGPQGRGFEITNEGLRIRPEDQERIFRRGYRTTRAEMATPDGSGIGLWLVQKIVDAHGARIRCREIFEGDRNRTAFQIFFPEEALKQSIVNGG